MILVLTATTSLNTCSNGTYRNDNFRRSDAGNTQYIDVDWSTDGSSWTSDGVSIAAGETTYTSLLSQNDGATIQLL